MNLSFPLIPLIPILAERIDGTQFLHVYASASLSIILTVIGLWGLFKMGWNKEYERSKARESYAYLGAALLFAVFGIYPFLLAFLVISLVCLASFAYNVLLRLVIWRFLIKWLIWGVFIKSFLVAFFPEKPVQKTKAKAKPSRGHPETDM